MPRCPGKLRTMLDAHGLSRLTRVFPSMVALTPQAVVYFKLSLISGCPMLSECSSGAASLLPPTKNNTWDRRAACLLSLPVLGCPSDIWLVF